ncbi:MAG: tRNA pseudouridine(55) synthase TruB, partial [Candidatus Zixiibacteriota bacterium]
TGTLDPRATGLLVICLGRATKIAQFLADTDKTYEAEIRLGMASETYDEEGIDPTISAKPVPDLAEHEVRDILGKFKGKILQRVPAYSAVRVGGQRLYKLARQRTAVEIPEREIEIEDIRLTRLDLPSIFFTVTCSKGTYVRTLANDIGERIGCGAYLKELSRTRVGPFTLDEAISLNEIRHYRQAGSLKRHIKPIEEVLPFPSIQVKEHFTPFIISGRSPRLKDISEVEGEFSTDDMVCLKDHTGRVAAVGKARIGSEKLKEDHDIKHFFAYVRVLN